MIDNNDFEFVINNYYNIRWTYKNYPINYNDLTSGYKFPLTHENYDDIKGIYCNDNINITRLPKLPLKLEMLWCDGNNIMDLGNFPDTLKLISCYGNPIIQLNISEYMTPHIRFCVASWTNIYEIYNLPDTIHKLYLASTKLKYISQENYKHAKRIWLNIPRNLDLNDTIPFKEHNSSYTDFFYI